MELLGFDLLCFYYFWSHSFEMPAGVVAVQVWGETSVDRGQFHPSEAGCPDSPTIVKVLMNHESWIWYSNRKCTLFWWGFVMSRMLILSVRNLIFQIIITLNWHWYFLLCIDCQTALAVLILVKYSGSSQALSSSFSVLCSHIVVFFF